MKETTNLVYAREKRKDGFRFSVKDKNAEKSIVIYGICEDVAEEFLNLLKENCVCPIHLKCVAEDFLMGKVSEEGM